jgi:hypothetical protein
VWLVAGSLAFGCGRAGFDDRTGASTLARSTLALDRTDPGEVLADFPLLVVLDDTRADRALIDPTASNVRFLDDNGDVIAHEIEQAGSPGGPPLIAWVRVPQIVGTTTTLTIEYGGTLPAASPDSVWSSAYVAVFHFDEPINPTDATTNHHDSISLGSTFVPGFLAGGRAFDPSQQEAVRIDDATDLALPIGTISGMFYENALASPYPYAALAARDNIGSIGALDFWLGEEHGSYALISIAPGTQTAVPGNLASAGIWSDLALVSTGTSLILYVDGRQRNTNASGPIPHSANPIYMGARSDQSSTANNDFLNGVLDEVRFQNVVRSPAWVQADDLSLRDELISYGPIMH